MARVTLRRSQPGDPDYHYTSACERLYEAQVLGDAAGEAHWRDLLTEYAGRLFNDQHRAPKR